MRKTPIKKVNVKNEKLAVIHICTEKEAIDQLIKNTNTLSIIITGNGDPEKGLCRKVAIIAERQDGIFKKLEEIHLSLVDYHEETEQAKNVALMVQSAFDKYKSTEEGKEIGMEKVSTQKQVNFNNTVSVIGTILVVIGLIITVIIGKREREGIDKKIENLGTPVIVNERGAVVPLPAGDSLKFYRDGEFKSTFRDSV